MMSFSMAVMKHNRSTVGRIEGHNARLHPTKSQLPKAAWFSAQGRHEVIAWNGEAIDRAKTLAKRKDAVLAIEIVFQIGNQTDWRDLPTPAHPHGKPKPGIDKTVETFKQAVVCFARDEFGRSNVASCDWHGDESTHHLHLVVTPIHEGKLQAKHWLAGAARVAQLRARAHKIISEAIPCAYVAGGEGGAPYDPGKAAGALPVRRGGILSRIRGAVSNVIELEAAKKRIAELETAQAALFAQLKRTVLTGLDETKQARTGAAIAFERAREAEGRASVIEAQLVALSLPAPECEAEEPRMRAVTKTTQNR